MGVMRKRWTWWGGGGVKWIGSTAINTMAWGTRPTLKTSVAVHAAACLNKQLLSMLTHWKADKILVNLRHFFTAGLSHKHTGGSIPHCRTVERRTGRSSQLWPAVVKRMSWRLDLRVAGSNSPTTGQLPSWRPTGGRRPFPAKWYTLTVHY